MKSKILGIALGFACILPLTACHTVEGTVNGAGQDVQAVANTTDNMVNGQPANAQSETMQERTVHHKMMMKKRHHHKHHHVVKKMTTDTTTSTSNTTTTDAPAMQQQNNEVPSAPATAPQQQ